MLKKSLLVVMFTLMTSLVYANPYGLFFPSHAPIMCGEYSAVESFLEEEGFKPVHIGFGRQGGEATGEPVFAVIHYKKNNELIATIETPDRIDKCVLYKIYDFVVVPQPEKE